jgi:hypothetical protein
VGTAFDYLFRFWLRHYIDQADTRRWVAYDGLTTTAQLHPEYVKEIEERIERAENLRDDFLDTGTFTRPLIEATLDLARIDTISRSGQEPTDLGTYDDGDIIDCLKILEILDRQESLRSANHVTLNPTFGIASRLVDGADADTIVDGTLIDVKTTGKAAFKVDYWRQLVGYLTLIDIHQTLTNVGFYDRLDIDSPSIPDIDSFGIYYARHGDLKTVSADIVYEADGYHEFRSWFVRTAINESNHLLGEDLVDALYRVF